MSFPLLILAAALQAPAAADQARPQSPAPGSRVREEDYRVARIGYRLGRLAAAYCPEPYPLTGLQLHHLAEYDAGDRPEAIARYGLDRGPGLLSVVEGSPAAAAGLRAGDVLITVNGRALPSPSSMAAGRDNEEARPLIEDTEAQIETAFRAGPASLGLLRDGQPFSVTLAPVPGCPARVRLARSPQMNAFANRGWSIITTALLGFTRSDDEIAIILGHEMAHNILNHPARLDDEGVPDGLFRSFGSNAGRVRATEEEADRLGLKMAWAAGYDAMAAIPYWRRYYARYEVLPPIFRTHPSLRARERLAHETLEELRRSGSDPGAERPELREGPLGER